LVHVVDSCRAPSRQQRAAARPAEASSRMLPAAEVTTRAGGHEARRLVSLARHTVRCVPSAPSLPHDSSYKLARPRTDALPARCTRLPAVTHAVHADALGSYACHTILHTPLPPKVLPAFTTPSPSSSYSYNHDVDGTPVKVQGIEGSEYRDQPRDL
jgi:hypothetical protein